LFLQKEDLANAVNAGATATQQMVLDEDDWSGDQATGDIRKFYTSSI
jgi:hypothetical protein